MTITKCKKAHLRKLRKDAAPGSSRAILKCPEVEGTHAETAMFGLVACRREIVSMGFGEKIGPNSWYPPCLNLLLAFGCGDRSNTFSATGH